MVGIFIKQNKNSHLITFVKRLQKERYELKKSKDLYQVFIQELSFDSYFRLGVFMKILQHKTQTQVIQKRTSF
jgi:hypothetical protein